MVNQAQVLATHCQRCTTGRMAEDYDGFRYCMMCGEHDYEPIPITAGKCPQCGADDQYYGEKTKHTHWSMYG